MKLEGDYLFEATVPEVWSALFDPVILAAVMPGCEKLELVDGHYIGDIKVKVGPIQMGMSLATRSWMIWRMLARC